jgi:hypothetical protein
MSPVGGVYIHRPISSISVRRITRHAFVRALQFCRLSIWTRDGTKRLGVTRRYVPLTRIGKKDRQSLSLEPLGRREVSACGAQHLYCLCRVHPSCCTTHVHVPGYRRLLVIGGGGHEFRMPGVPFLERCFGTIRSPRGVDAAGRMESSRLPFRDSRFSDKRCPL